jgi:hypothetical protein
MIYTLRLNNISITVTVALIVSQKVAIQAFTSRASHRHVSVCKPSNTMTAESPSSCLFLSSSKWDNLVDEDDNDAGPPIPPDMKYVERNVMRQHQNFVAIREAGGKEMTNDVYVREPSSGIFWFAGKVARVSDVSLADAVARQWPLIEQHAANLRPLELYPHRGTLEIWTAPGDSELDVAYNRPSIVFEKMSREMTTNIKNAMVGFSGEVYQEGEEGFRTLRNDDGRPAKPEINAGNEARAPSDEEMAQLEEKLQGQDLNALYKEQQRRKGKEVSD